MDCLSNKVSVYDIYSIVKAEGYLGSERTLRYHIKNLKDKRINAFDGDIVLRLSRDKLVKILWKDRGSLTPKQDSKLSIVLNEYKDIKELYKFVQEINQIFRGKDKTSIDRWLSDASSAQF
jgi:transposase